jgi:hypothetical protein
MEKERLSMGKIKESYDSGDRQGDPDGNLMAYLARKLAGIKRPQISQDFVLKFH